MNAAGKYDVIVFGAGTAHKVMAWNMAKAGRRTAVVERKYIGGAAQCGAHPTMTEGLKALFMSVPRMVDYARQP